MERKWLSAHDSRARDWHAALDGVTKPIDEPFENEFGEIIYPGDPAAHGANVYHCRCSIAAVVKGFQKFSEVAENGVQNIQKSFNNAENRGIIKSGAVSGARNPEGEAAAKHAEQYYNYIRSIKTDCAEIAKHTGKSEKTIQSIKNYLFLEEHDLGDGIRQFDADFMIAQSWQRLMDRKNILPHDLTLLNHEKFERKLVERGLTQNDAHIITSGKFNYTENSDEKGFLIVDIESGDIIDCTITSYDEMFETYLQHAAKALFNLSNKNSLLNEKIVIWY